MHRSFCVKFHLKFHLISMWRSKLGKLEMVGEDHCIFPLRRQKFKEIKNIYGSPSPYSKLAAPDDYMEYRNDTFKISQGENASCP